MTQWLLHNLVAASLFMLLVLALRRPAARLFGAGWAYALWAIPAVRLVLPPLPWPDIQIPVEVLIPTATGATAPLPASAGPGQWVPLLLAIWAGGAVIFLILQWLGYREFDRRLSGSARPARPPFYEGIATFVSALVEGPLAFGVRRPRIVVPADFSRRYSAGERRLAMEHELTHHRHRDLWWNMAAILVLALNWFNPIAWIAFRAFRTDQELACDASVASNATPEERHDYACAMVKSASRPGLIAACPMNGADALKRRLRMMRLHRASPSRSVGGVAALAVLALAGLSAGGGSAPVARSAARPPQVLAMRAAPALAPAAIVASPRRPPMRLAAALAPPIPIVVTGRVRASRPEAADSQMLAAADPEAAPVPESAEVFALAAADADGSAVPMPAVAPALATAVSVETPAVLYRLADGNVVAYRIAAAKTRDGAMLVKAKRVAPTQITFQVAQTVQLGSGSGRVTFRIVE